MSAPAAFIADICGCPAIAKRLKTLGESDSYLAVCKIGNIKKARTSAST